HVVVGAAGTAAIDVRRTRRRRSVALARRRLAGDVALAQMNPQQIDHGFLLSDFDLLTNARRLPLYDRGEDADARVQPGARVGETADGLGRRAVGVAGHAHRTGQGLCDPFERLVLRVRSGAAEAFHRRGDDARIELAQRLVPETQPVHRARAHVFDHDVRRLHEILEHLASARRLEVERDALLVRVQQHEEPRVLTTLVGQREAAGLAAWRLDLDDLGPQPREHLRARGAGFV